MNETVRIATARTDVHVTKEVTGLRFSDAVPGGYKACSFTLARPIAFDPEDLAQYADVWVYDGRSGDILWQGRLEDPGRALNDSGQLREVLAVGHAAQARDRNEPYILVDRSLERLKAPGNLSNGKAWRFEGVEYNDGGTIKRGVKIHVPRGTVVTIGGVTDIGDWVYDAIQRAGQYIARARWDHIEGVTDTSWRMKAAMRLDAGTSTVEEDDAFNVAAASIAVVLGTEWSTATDYNNLSVRMDRDTGNVTVADDATWVIVWDFAVRAVLKSALGADITTGYSLNSVKGHEVFADLIGRWLNKWDGTNASIDTSATHGIEQLAYPDGATPWDILDDVMLFEPGFYWAVREDRFGTGLAFPMWRPWDTTEVRYEADVADGFAAPGSAVELYNRATVRWRDADGRSQTTTRTATVTALDNAGLVRAAQLDLGDNVASLSNAQRAGDQFLLDHANPPNAGTLTLAGPVMDWFTGRIVQPSEVLSGYLIRVRGIEARVDALNPSNRDGVTIFRIVEREYDADSGRATLSLDSRSRALAKLLKKATKPQRRR